MTDTTTAPEAATDAPDTAPAADHPTEPVNEQQQDAQPQDGGEHLDDNAADHFPRHVVEKLRKENAGYRDRAKVAEQTIATMQRQHVEQAAIAAGLKPAALWAVTQLDDLLADNGAPDAGKIAAAVKTARDQLGIDQQRRAAPPRPGAGAPLRSGSGAPQQVRNPWSAAFKPAEKK